MTDPEDGAPASCWFRHLEHGLDVCSLEPGWVLMRLSGGCLICDTTKLIINHQILLRNGGDRCLQAFWRL